MQEIDVLFPSTGVPVVREDCHAVMEDEFIMWKVRSEHPDVKKITITFSGDHPDPGFFPVMGKRDTSITRDLAPVTFKDAPSIGFALVWAQAPRITGSAPRSNKYTVAGLDANGETVPGAELDPQIITERP